MSFLNLALLGGVLGLMIPVIIHFFHKSRFKTVQWGAMHLLESVIRSNQRRIRLEQIILLLIRAGIPLLLALAMARPVWKSAQSLLGEGKTSTVILLDNSYSMEAGHAGRTKFTTAQDEATRVVNGLKRGSDVQVVLMGEGGSALFDAPTYDSGRVTRALASLQAGYNSATVPAALDAAVSMFAQTREAARDLVVFTDFQRVSFAADEKKALGQALERLKKLPAPPRITFFDIGSEMRDNVAIESLDFSRLMIGVGQKIQIRANLRNFGSQRYPDLRVNLKADGKEKSVSQVTLEPGQKVQVLFTLSFETAGSHVVELNAEADALKADNLFLASIPVRAQLPVLLINGDPNPEPMKGETDFAEIALRPFGAGREQVADLISTTVVRPDELTGKMLSESAVVIMANVPQLKESQLRALEEFVRNGGGLLVFPGNRVDVPWYNQALFREGRGLLPCALGALKGDLKATVPPMTVVSERFENAALEFFNDSRNGNLSGSAIKLWFPLNEAGASAGAAKASILARLENGDPFLTEKDFGEGHVIACATAIDADWSNLPMRPTYLPLLQRLTVYLASTIYPSRNLDVGKPIIALLGPGDAGKKAVLTDPLGASRELPVLKKGGRAVVEFGQTQTPGLYTLTPPGAPPIHYALNTARRESDLDKLTVKELADFSHEFGVPIVRDSAGYQALDRARRFGVELWKPLFCGLLLLVFAEMFFQQRFAKGGRRPGAAKGMHSRNQPVKAGEIP